MQESPATTPQTIPPTDYPGMVSIWVAETIPQLEAAIHDGTLAGLIEQPEVQEIVGPEVTERYRAIAAEKLKHNAVFRRNWTLKFIEVFQQSLQAPRKLFPAKAGASTWSIWDATPPPLEVSHHPRNVILRPDQVLSSRRWGVWFTFEDEMLERAYLALLVGKSRQLLASNVKNLWNLEATYLSQRSNLSHDPEWHTGTRGGRFEHLMMDVLNEFSPVAKPAPLAEDILERTDLRVKYPGIKRENGSRVQVTLASDPKLHDRKVHALVVPLEFILLTPLELARCAVHPPCDSQFAEFAWPEFWTSLGGPRRDVHAFALELHDLFVEAISYPLRHPLGPIGFLSSPMRQFIQTFTQHRAAKSTNKVREREGKTGRWLGSVRKYTGRFWKAKLTEAPAQAEPAAQKAANDNKTGKE